MIIWYSYKEKNMHGFIYTVLRFSGKIRTKLIKMDAI